MLLYLYKLASVTDRSCVEFKIGTYLMMSIANYKTITYEGTNLLTLTLTPTFTKRRYPNKKYPYLVSRNIGTGTSAVTTPNLILPVNKV